jgi:hypothetical protein
LNKRNQKLIAKLLKDANEPSVLENGESRNSFDPGETLLSSRPKREKKKKEFFDNSDTILNVHHKEKNTNSQQQNGHKESHQPPKPEKVTSASKTQNVNHVVSWTPSQSS